MPSWAAAGAAVIGAVSGRNSSRRAANAQTAGQDAALSAVERGAQEARDSAIPLFQDAQQNALQGFGSALDLQNQISPAQISAFQQGNQNAQSSLLAGLPQFQNAILGGNIDMSALQQGPIQVDQNLFNQQLPDFTSINQSLNPEPPPQQPTTGFPGGGFPGVGGFGGSGNFSGFQNNQFPTGFQMPTGLINLGPQQPVQQPTTGNISDFLGGNF